MIEKIKKKKKASMVENMLVMMINMVVLCAFLVIIFGAFSGISDKWGMRQTAREYMLIMGSGLWKQNLSKDKWYL